MASDLDDPRRYGVVAGGNSIASDQENLYSSPGTNQTFPQHLRTHSFPHVKHGKNSAAAVTNNNICTDGELSSLQQGAATKTVLQSTIATERQGEEMQLHSSKIITNQKQQIHNGHNIHKQYNSNSTLALLEADTIETSKLSEKERLLEQLYSIRQKRDHIQQHFLPTLTRYNNELNYRHIVAKQSFQHVLSTLQTNRTQRLWTESEYKFACKCNALNDMFLIWHGTFGSISGLRLGRSAVTMIGLVKKCAVSGHPASGQAIIATSPSLFSWGTSEPVVSSNQEVNAAQSLINNNNNSNSSSRDPEKVVVPWNEINAALGQIVLLLYTLQNTPLSGISFKKYVLQPCGSFSKIGLLKNNVSQTASSPQRPNTERRRITALAAYLHTDNNTSAAKVDDTQIQSKPMSNPKAVFLPHEVTWYNLHHYEESGSVLSLGYYSRRNFNTALEALLFCIAETCLIVEKRDMALAAPYTIRVGGLVVGKDSFLESKSNKSRSDDEATVGGVPISYDPAEGERWTLVCKYLLTNLKWAMAYAIKQNPV